MKKVWELTKLLIIFLIAIGLFFYSLQLMHSEFRQYQRYDRPMGPAIKVNHPEDDRLFKRFNIFFHQGE